MFKKGHDSWIKGTNIQTNTGRTHWKKGHIPWNKNKKMPYTEARRKYDERQRGKIKPKPKNFSAIMRKVRPPKGRKVSASGYVFIYRPRHPNSGKHGYVRQSWYIMSEHIGRPLKAPEVVHHLDGDKQHDTYKNLVLCNEPKDHNAIHNAMGKFVEGLIKDGKVKYDRKRRKFCFR